MPRAATSLNAAHAVCVLALLALGCGDDAACEGAGCVGAPDGSVDGGDTPPDIPWLAEGVPPIAPAELTPCPGGWREVPPGAEGDPPTCDPYPEGGALDCPDDQAHFPGEPGCAPVGSPCPAGDFSESLPTDRRIVYVRPGATGGDGTEALPYGSVTEFSVGGLPSGSVIALSRGMHRGPFSLVRRHVLWGACVAETVLTTDVPSTSEGVVTIRVPGGELRDLTIADSPSLGVYVFGAGNEARIEGVVITGVERFGLDVYDGARLTVETMVVRDTRSQSRDLHFGRAVNVEGGATVEATRAIFAHNRDVAIALANPYSTVSLADVVVRDTESREADGFAGRGLSVVDGAAADLSRTLVENNREVAVNVSDAGSAATLTDVVVRDTRSQQSDRRTGRGLHVQYGASADVTRALFAHNRDVAVYAGDPGTTMRLADVVVRDTQGQESDGLTGGALAFVLDAVADVRRAHLVRNRTTGVVIGGPNIAVTMADVVVRDIQGQEADGLWGLGLTFVQGGAVEVERMLVERSRSMGITVSAPDTALTLTDVLVRETLGRDCAATSCADVPIGHGVTSYNEGHLSMTRFVVEQALSCGLHIARGGQMDLQAGEVREHPIGLCLQEEGYDLGRVMEAVRFISNGVNLQSTSLPVPNPAEALPARL